MRFWGQPDFSGTVEMVKKTTLKTPERIVIKPGEAEAPIVKPAPAPAAKAGAAGTASASADYDLEALELRDMPKGSASISTTGSTSRSGQKPGARWDSPRG